MEEIYVHSGFITELNHIVRCCQVNNKFEALYQWEEHCDHLVEVYNNCPVVDEDIRNRIQKIFRLTPQVNNCAKLIDLIKLEVRPLMYALISLYGKIDVSDGRRRFLSSRAGYLTICGQEDQKYWYSRNDPMEEAWDIAEKIYDPKNTEYHIWGAGLGYLAYQLSVMSQRSVKIHIYEAEQEMLDYGRNYGVLDWINQEKLVLHWDPTASEFLRGIDEKKRNYYISRPDMRYRQGEEYSSLQRLYYNCRFWMEEGKALKINLEKNLKNKKRLWKDIHREGFEHSIVVAAGPSLDQCLDFLRQREGKIIAVGTVFRKLTELGIVPDLVVISECDSIVYEQMAGLEEAGASLLLSPYSYWKLAQNYKGKVYFAQVDSELDAGDFYSENAGEQFQIGGTVSFFAMEAAVRLGAEEVDLLGLDLAFPAKMSHAEGTPRNTEVSKEKLIQVPGVGGGTVDTDLPFDLYRREIEGLIRRNPQVVFRNHSSIGARIEGTYQIGV